MDNISLFCKNFLEINKTLKQGALVSSGAALIYTSKQKEVSTINLINIKNEFKSRVSIFSSLRNSADSLIYASMDADGKEDSVDKIIKNYQTLRKDFSSSYYLPLVAYLLVDQSEEEVVSFSSKMKELYKKERKNHPFLTGGEDYGSLALMIKFSSDLDKTYASYISCYDILKEKVKMPSNARQTTAMILALDDDSDEEKVNRFVEIYNALKNNKIRFGNDFFIPLLGISAIGKVNPDSYVEKIKSISAQLKHQPELKGIFGCKLNKGTRNAYACLLSLNGQELTKCTLISSIIHQIINYQTTVCICTVCCATTACAASSTCDL